MIILLYSILMIILVLSFIEIAMLFLVRHPRILRLLSSKLQNSISYLYVRCERKILQFQEGCGQYHSELGYTLKPGEFIFTEREFSNVYSINSLGVRDTKEAIAQPEIVIVGDSFAFGWGVNQDETFAKLIERKTKCKTLNTSVPSYGTVREMMMLRRIDRSKLKCLIIQYCDDDYDENLRYYMNGNRPQIMRAETFSKLVAKHSRIKPYFFGQYLCEKIKKKLDERKPQAVSLNSGTDLDEADLFLHVLKQNEDLLKALPIIIFEMNGINQTNHFTTSLKQKICADGSPSFIQTIKLIDMSHYLTRKDFYVLDSHLTAQGHVLVADVLYNSIKSIGLLK